MSLRSSAYTAGRWTTASTLFRAFLQVAQTIILARLLVPADFGLMALVAAALAILMLFADLGLSSALIHFPRPDRRTLSTLYWLNLAASLGLMVLFGLLAWPLARLYQQPALAPVILAMSLAFPLSALGQQFRTLAEKELRFAVLARIEVAAALLGFSTAIMLAAAGAGVYALVAAPLVSVGCSSVLAWLFLSKDSRPGPHFNPGGATAFIRFGAYRLGEALWSNLRMQADVFIGGLFVGPAAMGAYAVPRDLSLRVANTVVNPVVTRVGLPVMAKVQGDLAALKYVYLQTLRMTAAVNFPVYAVLAVFAEDLVAFLLGSQWQDSGFYLRLFALWGMIRSVGNPVGSLLYAAGHVRRAFWWNLVLLLIVPAVLWIAATRAGIEGIAWAMLVLQALIFLPAWRFLVRPACGASLREYLRHLSPPFAATAAAAAIGLGVATLAPPQWEFAAGCASLGASYLVLSYYLNREWLLAILELLQPAWGRPR